MIVIPGSPLKSLSSVANGQPKSNAEAAIHASAVFSLRPDLSRSALNRAESWIKL
jgi:hypothetical protein